jgi:methionyl-tRNA formyltransferase
MGNRNLAVHCLEALTQWQDVELVAVVACHYDEGATDTWYSSVKRLALARNLKLYQPKSVNQASFLLVLSELQPDLILSVHYDKILRSPVLSIPRLGCVNIHFGLLPRFRGSFPLVWAMVLNEPAGVTMHYMDTGIDTGDVIAQQEVLVTAEDTARSVYDKAVQAGYELFQNYLPIVLQGNSARYSQDGSRASYFPPGYPYDRWIDWNRSAVEIDRFVRALTFLPYPTARTLLGSIELECLHPMEVEGGPQTPGVPGQIVEADDRLGVVAKEGVLHIRRLRVNEVDISASDFVREYRIQLGTSFHSPLAW